MCVHCGELPRSFLPSHQRGWRRWVRFEARLWNGRDQESCTEEGGSVETRENKVKIDTSGRRKDPQLSSLNPPPSPLFLCSFRPLLLSVWLECITSMTRILVTAYYLALCLTQQSAARTGRPSVHAACYEPAAEDSRKQRCLGAKETQNNSPISFLGENGVRIGGDLYTQAHIFPPFCYLGAHRSGLKVEGLK